MQLTRRIFFVYGLLALFWLLVLGWQIEEHARVKDAARTNLSNRSRDIANTVSACIRGMQFRGTVLQDRLEPLLRELVTGGTNEWAAPQRDLVSIVLLNAAGESVASAGDPIDFKQSDILQKGERWGRDSVVVINPVDLGAALTIGGSTNPTVVLPAFQPMTNAPFEPSWTFPRREPRPDPETGMQGSDSMPSVRSDRDGRSREGEPRFRRPPWMRGLNDQEFHALLAKRAIHGLAVAISTDSVTRAVERDLWLRGLIVLLASVAVAGFGFAWRSLGKSSELQIRLVRASELNTHLKEMNLAAAGLAHETRNPLNIIRGLAQMISRKADCAPEIQQKSKEILEEVDKVAAQLNEFINYSRPRDVRRTSVGLGPVIQEVVRTLGYDLEEKNIRLQVQDGGVTIEADEQLLRQTLFNLLINAIQAVNHGGEIVVAAERNNSSATLEVRDNGPGVAPEHRQEIFKPYFTTHERGTGLGLAVVQQNVLAHGWEIECLPNRPNGAVFRLQHLKVVA